MPRGGAAAGAGDALRTRAVAALSSRPRARAVQSGCLHEGAGVQEDERRVCERLDREVEGRWDQATWQQLSAWKRQENSLWSHERGETGVHAWQDVIPRCSRRSAFPACLTVSSLARVGRPKKGTRRAWCARDCSAWRRRGGGVLRPHRHSSISLPHYKKHIGGHRQRTAVRREGPEHEGGELTLDNEIST
jgi:hypothetical protein